MIFFSFFYQYLISINYNIFNSEMKKNFRFEYIDLQLQPLYMST